MLCVSDINKQSHMLRTIRFWKVIGWRKKIKENVSRPLELGRKTNEYEIYSLFRLEIHHNNQSELNDIWCHVLFGRAFYLWWCAERFALHTQSPGTCKHFFEWFRFETRAELIKNCRWNLNTQPNSLLGCVFFFGRCIMFQNQATRSGMPCCYCAPWNARRFINVYHREVSRGTD
jgi:hypothetical protein